ncbi:alpha/beta fold hydrolase [Mycobacterium sp. GA-2829]|uniref:alpha/beta fold hydrolase n=1 Tax=Mycobacterium sp. GA-2829 TaxID=1772283 RepID=UPI00073FBFF9|nr:alpha/beta hydrolase [Mycobacterium sp. GA-2829]KUI31449.1 alpha/beta hydrolase [Mycobacterium sp. GA-2829]
MPRLPGIPALAAVGELPPGRTVDLPGRGSTYVHDSGPQDGPTYLLLHSVACTGLMTWYPALDVVKQFGRVVVFDQRCHGSGIPSSRFLLEDCADDAAALADALGIRTFVPVGYSMGSLVAQLIWRRHPGRVDGLVLCAAAAAVSRAAYERLATGIFAALIDAFSPPLRGPSGTPVCAAADGVFGVPQWLLDQFRSTSPGAITRAIAEITRFDSRPWIPEIDVPTAVVITMRDRAFGTGRQRWLADRIPEAVAVPVDAGHASCTLQSAKFVPALAEAISSVHDRVIAAAAS